MTDMISAAGLSKRYGDVAALDALQGPVRYALAWIAVILAVFVPLSTRQYKRSAGR